MHKGKADATVSHRSSAVAICCVTQTVPLVVATRKCRRHAHAVVVTLARARLRSRERDKRKNEGNQHDGP